MDDSIQLKLNAIWGKNFLGLAIDQVIDTYQLPPLIIFGLRQKRGNN